MASDTPPATADTERTELVAAILRPDLFGPDATHPTECSYCDSGRDSARKKAAKIIAALSSQPETPDATPAVFRKLQVVLSWMELHDDDEPVLFSATGGSAFSMGELRELAGVPPPFPDVLRCKDCGRPYGKGPDLVVSDADWERIAPIARGGIVLCPNCMNDRFEAIGAENVAAKFTSGPFAIYPSQPETQPKHYVVGSDKPHHTHEEALADPAVAAAYEAIKGYQLTQGLWITPLAIEAAVAAVRKVIGQPETPVTLGEDWPTDLEYKKLRRRAENAEHRVTQLEAALTEEREYAENGDSELKIARDANEQLRAREWPLKATAEAYRVEIDNAGCDHCGTGKNWTVVGPGDVAIGESYGEEADAHETAGMLNHAFAQGRALNDAALSVSAHRHPTELSDKTGLMLAMNTIAEDRKHPLAADPDVARMAHSLWRRVEDRIEQAEEDAGNHHPAEEERS